MLGRVVAQRVALPPHSSIAIGLILSLGYCLCGVSHVLRVLIGLVQVCWCPSTVQNFQVGKLATLNCTSMWMSVWICVNGEFSHLVPNVPEIKKVVTEDSWIIKVPVVLIKLNRNQLYFYFHVIFSLFSPKYKKKFQRNLISYISYDPLQIYSSTDEPFSLDWNEKDKRSYLGVLLLHWHPTSAHLAATETQLQFFKDWAEYLSDTNNGVPEHSWY